MKNFAYLYFDLFSIVFWSEIIAGVGKVGFNKVKIIITIQLQQDFYDQKMIAKCFRGLYMDLQKFSSLWTTK